MTRIRGLCISLLLLIAALPLVSVGMSDGRDALWKMGLVLLGAGAGMALLTRYTGRDKENGRS